MSGVVDVLAEVRRGPAGTMWSASVYWLPRPRVEDRDVLLVGAASHGHIDGVADEVGSHVVGHGVADDLLG